MPCVYADKTTSAPVQDGTSLGRKHLQAVLDNTVEGIIVIDTLGTVQSVNPACERIFGYTSDEVVGQNVKMLMPDHYRREHDSYIANYNATGQARVIGIGREVTGLRKDGREFPLDLSVGEVNDGSGHFFVGIVRDISERKRAEQSIRDYTAQLKRSNQDLDDFVYIVSHDLKEPLRGIYGYAQFLEEDYAGKLDDDGREKLATLRTLSLRMSELIDSLLEYSRLGRSGMAVGKTDLGRTLDGVLEVLGPTLRERGAEVRIVSDLPVVMCDGVRVGEVFSNLIVNATKYNDNPAKVIEIGSRTMAGDGLGDIDVLFVRDNGIGIPPEFHDSVFKMFKRLHARDTYGGGTGSGLAIVKKIIDRHGGRIWIESDGCSGTTFCFTLGA